MKTIQYAVFCLGKNKSIKQAVTLYKYIKETVLLVFMSVYSKIMYSQLKLHQADEIGTNLMLLALCSESYKPKCSWVTNSNKGGLISESFLTLDEISKKMCHITPLSIVHQERKCS